MAFQYGNGNSKIYGIIQRTRNSSFLCIPSKFNYINLTVFHSVYKFDTDLF